MFNVSLSDLFRYFLGIPKTVYFNFKYLPVSKAVKLPVLVSHKVYFLCAKGEVTVTADAKFGRIKIGFDTVGIFDKWKDRTIWEVTGKINFHGKAVLKHGCKISCAGEITFGDNFSVSSHTAIICRKKIVFGKDAVISWNALIMDTDFQKIRDENWKYINPDKEIIIGDNVWIGCNSIILKGVIIADYCIISAGAVVVKKMLNTRTVIAGNPAKEVKQGYLCEIDSIGKPDTSEPTEKYRHLFIK